MNNVVQSYENYKEEERITTNNARKIEFITTIKAMNEVFPIKAKILDCAAGTGVYAFYYADRKYEVTALDITPRHIEYIKKENERLKYNIYAAVNDATDLSSIPDESFDVVLCMGPIYHLISEDMRRKCISECNRVLKKDGIIVVAYINRFYVFPYISTSDKKYLNMELGRQLVKTGIIRDEDTFCFWTDSYYATTEEMEKIFKDFSIDIIDHLATDGISPMLRDKIDKMSEEEFEVWCDYHYMVCREKSILGASNHGLIIGRKIGAC